jgi:electron transfer flavoprotein beta subunit
MSGFHVVVLMKPVPDPKHYDRVEIDPATGALARHEMTSVLNPADRHALEEALLLQERFGGRVTLMSMAPESAAETVREALAMGGEEAVILSDRGFAGSDSLATSMVLAAGVDRVAPFDLVLAGNESADGGTVHVPSQVGELLDVAHLSNVIRLEVAGDRSVQARVRIENGYMDYESSLPMVIGVRREINTPRYPSLMGVVAAQEKPIHVIGATDLGVDLSRVGIDGSWTRPGRLTRPTFHRKAERIMGSPEEAVKRIMGILRAEGVLR